ncbi:SCO2322 family protein [Streptomyces sp. NBC_00893]|uniref:SCO2322 family protein n=1 Tax=Streptomyces sp. NBC_00893 TaxID=2975862 RepID=UPI002259C564|nr:SCO2322 family protein [Streptomyces sp. NBC_00893]MCX4848244.1 SCO2322 family protein [Streptomyces sp. NBC_00893]
MRRAGRTTALLVVLGAVLAVLGAGPAQAAGYRYWSFWEGSGSGWTYATQGPSLIRPDDGAVQGFRFSVSEDSQDSAKPRRAPEFTKICADTPAEDGTKRIALVIDPGTAADAPAGETPPAPRTACARVAPDASAAEALASVAKPLRYNSDAMLCAISGYPGSGCGEQVSGDGNSDGSGGGNGTPDASVSSSASPAGSAAASTSGGSGGSGGGPSAGVLVGVGAVLLLGIAAVVQARRRRG